MSVIHYGAEDFAAMAAGLGMVDFGGLSAVALCSRANARAYRERYGAHHAEARRVRGATAGQLAELVLRLPMAVSADAVREAAAVARMVHYNTDRLRGKESAAMLALQHVALVAALDPASTAHVASEQLRELALDAMAKQERGEP